MMLLNYRKDEKRLKLATVIIISMMLCLEKVWRRPEELFDDHESSMTNHPNYLYTGRAQSRPLTALMEYLNAVLEYFIFSNLYLQSSFNYEPAWALSAPPPRFGYIMPLLGYC